MRSHHGFGTAAAERRRAGSRLAAAAMICAGLAGGCVQQQLGRGLPEPYGPLAATMASAGDIGLEPPAPNLRQVDLPSGLRVGFERAPTRGMVGVVLVVGAGSTGDPAGKEGLAHLVEHLGFHATFDGQSVSDTLARLGATYNADTSLDRTRFYEFAPRAALPALLRLAAQRLTHPLGGVDRAAVTVEREIVENELRQRNETLVYGQVAAWMQRALFPASHPYARPTGGTRDSVSRLSLEDARAFADAAYAPRNATLLIVGDFDAAAAAATAARDLPPELVGDAAHPRASTRGTRPPPPPYLPGPPPAGFEVMRAPVAWPEIWLSYYLADMYGPYAPAMKVMTAPVVVKTLRDILLEDEDVADVDLVRSEFRQATVLSCRITLISDRRSREIAERARQLIAAMWQPIAIDQAPRWAGDGAAAGYARLARTQRLALADAIFDSESFVGRAVSRAEYFHMTGAINAYDALVAAVAGLPAEALVQHGGYLLAPDRARLLFLQPLPEQERPPPGVVGVPSVDSRAPKMGDAPGRALDFGDPPPAPPLPELRAADVFRLPNGLRVALIRRPEFPAVTAALGFRGGTAASPPGVIELLRLLERDGVFALDQNALEIRKADGDDYAADVVVAGHRNLSNALFMLGARLRVLDGVHWGTVMTHVRESGARHAPATSPAARASRAFWRALYGEHPYGRVMNSDELRAVDSDQIKAWLPRIYNPANATLVIAGDFDLGVARDLVTRWFYDWSGLPGAGSIDVPPVAPVAADRPREAVIVTHRPGSTQVDVQIGCRLPAGNDPRGLAVGRTLAGAIAGHLKTRLREEAGAAYTVAGNAAVLRAGGAHLVIRAAIDNLRFREAMRVIRGHWAHFGRDGFDRGTLSQVKWDLVRASNLGFQTSAETAVSVLDAANEDWTPQLLATLPDAYRAVTTGDLARAFATCRSSTVISLLGDQPTIDAALK
jgi:zinc protease